MKIITKEEAIISDLIKTIDSRFADKLKKLNVYDKYINNLLNNTIHSLKELEIKIKYLNHEQYFGEFINASFGWSRTNEGFDFWEKISNNYINDEL